MPIYTNVPTKDQWKRDLGLATIFGNFKSPFPAMERLGKLIAAYHQVPGTGVARRLDQAPVLFLMYRQCQYVSKNNDLHGSRDKMGGRLNTSQLGAVRSFERFLESDLMDFLGCQRWEFSHALTESFGRMVTQKGKEEDDKLVSIGEMPWFRTDAERQQFKLSFRGGIAHQWRFDVNGRKLRLEVYDTDAEGDNLEFGGSLYAMDNRGRIYVLGSNKFVGLKHSSFMAGGATQCAGTIRFVRGKLAWVSGRSGHYQPSVAQMVTLLERLSAYQVDLSRAIVYRENESREFQNTPHVHFEGCPALEILRQRAWPTGRHPQSMKVGRNG